MRLMILVLALSTGACTLGVDRRAAYLNGLIGQPETEVVRQLGVPSRTYEAGGHKFLAYTEQRSEYLAGGPFFIGGGFYGGGFYGSHFGYGGFPAEVVQRQCETTIDVANSRVVTWSLRGNACG